MTRGRLLLPLVLAGAAAAQDHPLSSRVSVPLVYIAVTPAADGDAEGGDWATDLRRLGLELTGGGAGETLALLQGLLAGGAGGRAWSELELALTGVLPVRDAADLPLLVCRAQLRVPAAARMRALLERGDLAVASRDVGAHRVFRLATAPEQPGRMIEFALLGADLAVSNDGRALDQLLDEQTTSAAREVLDRDPVYRELRDELGADQHSVLVYADVARLQHRLTALLGGERAWFLRWSGLASTERMLLAIRPSEGGGTHTSVLLRVPGAPDGWLALVERAAVADLVRQMRPGGVGGVAFALEPSRLIAADTAGGTQGAGLAALRANLNGGCSQLGLDFEHDVAARLGRGCGLQLYGPPADGAAIGAAVLSLQAKSHDAARRLFAACKQKLAASGADAAAPDARDGERLVIDAGEETLHVALVDDAVALAFHGFGVEQAMRTTAASSPRERQRAARETMAALERLGAGKHREAGAVFRFDLQRLAPRDRAATASPTSSYVLCRHTGYLDREPGRMRVEILSEE